MQPVFDKNLFLKFCVIELMFYYRKKNVYKPALLLSLPSTMQTPFSHWHFTGTEKWQWGIEGVLAIFQAVLIMRLYTSQNCCWSPHRSLWNYIVFYFLVQLLHLLPNLVTSMPNHDSHNLNDDQPEMNLV